MMIKITIILVAIMLSMVIGCSNKDVIKHSYTYKGEDEVIKVTINLDGKIQTIELKTLHSQ